MNCDRFQRLLSFVLYDELSLEEENDLHDHMETCAACRERYVREQAMHRLLEEDDAEIPADLLLRCRGNLRQRLQHEHSVSAGRSVWRRLWEFEIPISPAIWKPAGALALVAVGFLGARLVPAGGADSMLQTLRGGGSEPVTARVRYVNTDRQGDVQLVVDETRQRVVKGRLDDNAIRELMLGAARDPDPGVRVESIGILKDDAQASDVRQALLDALQNDTNVGVRWKALEGLKPFAGDPATRSALSHVLLTDDNAGIRTKAIDLLTQSRERDSVGVLQELMHKEDNAYIRQRCQRALRDMNASTEIF